MKSLYILQQDYTGHGNKSGPLINHHHQSILPKGRSFTASAGTQAAVLPKAGLPPQTQEPRVQFYQGLNRCNSFPLHSALFYIIIIRVFTASIGTQTTVLPKAGLPPQTQEPRLHFYQGLNTCSSLPLLSALHSLFSN